MLPGSDEADIAMISNHDYDALKYYRTTFLVISESNQCQMIMKLSSV
ncbi:MAG: hypothetical protein ACLS28_23250 [Clostridium neonatale]